MERLINILIIDDNEQDVSGLKEILAGNGNILISCDSIEKAHEIMQFRQVGVVLVNVDSPLFHSMDDLKVLLESYPNNSPYTILITDNIRNSPKLIKGFKNGAVDFINKPFHQYLIQAKIGVYKSLYFKDKRIDQLLRNILPPTVLDALKDVGKFSPKRIDNGVVLFTDFVDFSFKSKNIRPLKLVSRLENYFTRFDEITERYKLEKIKTIGDSYMALAGVTEDNEEPILRTFLAAIEIRDYIRNERDVARAMKRDYWDIRIGIHCGPLVAGIIGSSRYSFDVWGDTVNIAARAQQISEVDQITFTKAALSSDIEHYFDIKNVGEVPIQKRGGTMELFQLEKIKLPFSLYGFGKYPNVELRKKCKINANDFDRLRTDILNKLKSLLPDELMYHDLLHTLNVEKAAIRLAKMEGLNEDETLILRTSALFHDSGFIYTNERNELHSVRLMRQMVTKYGYSEEQMDEIERIIMATSSDIQPETKLEKLMCDADHDYLGRADYYMVASKLREELLVQGHELSEKEWLQFQIEFLQNKHIFYSETSMNIRQKGKENRIEELKEKLKLV